MEKYRIIDLGYTLLLILCGFVGLLNVYQVSQQYNYLLLFFAVTNFFTIPFYIFSILKHKFPICIFPGVIIFLYCVAAFFSPSGTTSKVFSRLVYVCMVISLLTACVIMVFFHLKGPAVSVARNFGKLIKDSLIIFLLFLGTLVISNIAFDFSEIKTIEVEIIDISSFSSMGAHDVLNLGMTTVYVEYTGNDAYIDISEIRMIKYQTDNLDIGDRLILRCRTGFWKDPYCWIE